MIPRQIAAFFTPALQMRGSQYMAQRRVRLDAADGTHVGAWVQGSVRYRVTLDARPGSLLADCACPYALDFGVCKHLWATLLEADATLRLAPLLALAGPTAILRAYDSDDPLPSSRPADPPPRETKSGRGPLRPPPEWKTALDSAKRHTEWRAAEMLDRDMKWPEDRRLVYIVDLPATSQAPGIAIELNTERRKSADEWELPKPMRLGTAVWTAIPDERDRRIAQMLLGAAPAFGYVTDPKPSRFILRGSALGITLRAICETGRCRLRRTPNERPTEELHWDHGAPWRLIGRLVRSGESQYDMSMVLERDGEEMSLAEPTLLHMEGVLFARGLVSRLDHQEAFGLAVSFRERRALSVKADELGAMLEALHRLPRRPPFALPPEAQVSEHREAPVPAVDVLPDPGPWRHRSDLTLSFRYGEVTVARTTGGSTVFDRSTLTLHHRDPVAEQAALQRLIALGAKEQVIPEWNRQHATPVLSVADGKVANMVTDLLGAGWEVAMSGARYRPATGTRAQVRSGIDWFELDAGVQYGEFDVSLSALLDARRRGESMVTLPDGSRGLLPDDWLDALAPFVAGSSSADGRLRYKSSQVALLDVMLASLPETTADDTFETARSELQRFQSVAPAEPPATFTGTLRTYQREGLGWLHFLRRFKLGGCLADDMGLGKTVQVLALLDARRAERVERGEATRPSIVVVPRSLIFNWKREAERFTPQLRLLDHSGTDRRRERIDAAACDVVLITYGTLRRDAAELATIPFDYAILDEAQAIKNPSSAASKAARLLVADHRLAMTGTPIENRLEELWSLCEFLNPGMFGGASGFSKLIRGTPTAEANRETLSRALRPIILRRTKEQVASDLPARSEQTLLVELEPAQRKFYDGLLAGYRRSVMEHVDAVGVGKARMHILEALLRLRQAACHPVLADKRKSAAPSAKLDALMPALEEVIAQGHKALVFSQFTSFLALLRERLDAAQMPYEYLDGRIRDRQARVDRFQAADGPPLFLISLKAGGHGLNLTAADYVYLLDPWWNPAVEAQAIDRAHRIGQERHVLATRLVARGTIEQKILELQASKRALAEAILGEDQGVLAKIGREELEMLLA